jgi:hypothetical protein
MNVKQKQARAIRLRDRTLHVRETFWPAIKESQIWNRKRDHGFTTIPRTLPLIGRIMDQLSKGKPVFMTYLALWSRVFDEGIVEIAHPRELAYESGFAGERQESTWIARMRILVEQGFILAAESHFGEFGYVLILNPYFVARKLFKEGKIQQELYLALERRADEIGAVIPE